MFYLSFVLLSTLVISAIIYIIQLSANLWGENRMEKQKVSKGLSFIKRNKHKGKKKGIEKSEPVKTEPEKPTKSSDVEETNNNPAAEDGLKVTIICNKEPIIEKIDSKKEIKSTKSSRILKIFSCFKRENKKVVNIPRSEWLGPSDCMINKNVKLCSNMEVSKHSARRKTVARHEDVQESWENSVIQHLERRRRTSGERTRGSLIEDWRQRYRLRRFQVYSLERLSVQTVNIEKPQCKSIYVISHVKRRRKLTLKSCSKCGK